MRIVVLTTRSDMMIDGEGKESSLVAVCCTACTNLRE